MTNIARPSLKKRDASVRVLESVVDVEPSTENVKTQSSSTNKEKESINRKIWKRKMSDLIDEQQIRAFKEAEESSTNKRTMQLVKLSALGSSRRGWTEVQKYKDSNLALVASDDEEPDTIDLEHHPISRKNIFVLPLVMLLIVMSIMNGSTNQEVGNDLSALDNEEKTVPKTRDLSNVFLKEDKLECIVTVLEALVPPGVEELPKQYFCEAKSGEVYSFDSDPSPVLTSGFISGQTTMKLPMRYLDRRTSQILVSEASQSNSVVTFNPIAGRGPSTIAGEFDVLVIRVVDGYNHAPKQSVAKLHNDIFGEAKSLSDMIDECSNSKLRIMPAEGDNVVKGVLTVKTSENLATANFKDCGKYGTNAAKHIHRHYTMIVCPDEVEFNGAAAYAERPGRISYFMSTYASYKFIHLHEIAHNLGGFHSGTLAGGSYDDYTCALGNKGAWNESGAAFCFNGVKTWQFGWYSDYHREIDPSEHPHKGDLYGINAVNDKSIQKGNGDVDIRISSSKVDEVLYVTYLRKTGPNRDVPKYGNSILIHRTVNKAFDMSSELITSMKAGQKYARDWDGAGKLIIEVCSIDVGSPGKANILIYAGGNDGGMKCDSTAPKDPVPPTVANDSPPKPDNTCQDSFGKISFTNNAGKNIKKPCSWVAKNTDNRCKIPEIKEGCPVTCGADCHCIQTSGSFKVNAKQRSCEFVERNKEVRCKKRLFYANCPKVCTPVLNTKAKHCTE